MPGPHPKGLKSSLALAVANGKAIAKWAREHEVGVRTAHKWAKDPGFRAKVSELRRRLLDRAIGELARRAAANAAQINKLATSAESEGVRLAAARAGISDLIGASQFTQLRAEVEELKQELEKEKKRRASGAGQNPG
jgi:hypothetical protein